MKKLTLGLMAIFSSYVGETMASVPTGLSRCTTNVPTFQGGFTFGFQGLYWRATTPELDYALTFPSDISVYRSVIDSGYRAGFSANMGYIFGCSGNDFRISYTHWDNKYNDNIDNIALIPALTGIFNTGTFEGSFPSDVTFNGTAVFLGNTFNLTATVPAGTVFFDVVANFDITAASATANFNDRSADLEFGQTANIGSRMRLHWFGGLRYANLENTLEANYSGVTEPTIISVSLPVVAFLSSGSFDSILTLTAILVFDVTANFTDSLNQKTDFEGIGPRFGFDASYHLGLGFGLAGGLSAALLIGKNDANLTEFFDLDGLATFLTLPPDGSTLIGGADIGISDITITSITPASMLFNDSDLTTFQHASLTRVVPNLEAYIGVDWTYEFPNCNKTLIDIQLGYKITHYFNAIDRLSAVGADAPAARTRHIDDVQFEGPYIGIQINL